MKKNEIASVLLMIGAVILIVVLLVVWFSNCNVPLLEAPAWCIAR